MAGDFEIAAKVFGDKELVAGLGAFERQMRMRIFGGLKVLARAYAEDVASSGLAEQGIQSRTGLLRSSFAVRGRLTAASASVLVYPNATDPKRKYRYPWALGKGSPKNEVTVRAHMRDVPAGAKGPSRRTRNSRKGRLYSERQVVALTKAGATQVATHTRKINMKPRPFMTGGAFTRLQASFAQRMERAIVEAIAEAKAAAAPAGDFDGLGVG